jgi:hypothetical protein
VVSQNSGLLAPLAVDAVLHIADPATECNADLNNIKVLSLNLVSAVASAENSAGSGGQETGRHR